MVRTKKSAGRKVLTVRLPAETHHRLKIACAITGEEINTVVAKLIEKWTEQTLKAKASLISGEQEAR